MTTLHGPVSASGCRHTTIHDDGNGGTIFLTESGAIGMEFNGRLSVHTIERWIAYSWNDLDNTHSRNFPDEAAKLRLGIGDNTISLRGHPYEK